LPVKANPPAAVAMVIASGSKDLRISTIDLPAVRGKVEIVTVSTLYQGVSENTT